MCRDSVAEGWGKQVMDKTFEQPRVLSRAQNFVFFTPSAQRADVLSRALDGIGRVDRLPGDAAYITRSVVILKPALAFVDFTAMSPGAGAGQEGADGALAPQAVVETLRRCLPEALLIGVGNASDAQMTLTALRSGVADFLDLEGPADVMRASVTKLTDKLSASTRRAVTIAIAGARIGVGTSTFATHLATMLAADENAPRHVALLDLGLPVGDGLLYTNTPTGFDFADAVTALCRLDETLVRTALPVSPKGVSVLALPADLSRMRALPQADAVSLVDQIRRYFDAIIVDLGGAGSADLTASVLNMADLKLVLTDQGIASVVSLSDLLSQLDERSVDRKSLRLVVNKYDESYGMAAQQLTERFAIALGGTLPDRRLALGRAASLGQLLSGSKQDPYIRSVQQFIEMVQALAVEVGGLSIGAAALPTARGGNSWSNVSKLWRRG